MKPRPVLALLASLLPASTLASPWPETVVASFADPPAVLPVPTPRPLEEVPLDLDRARAADQFFAGFGFELGPAQREALQRDKFVLIPVAELPFLDLMEREPHQPQPGEEELFPSPTGGLAVHADEMLAIYTSLASGDIEPWRNHFVTTDSILHAWHRFFENALEEVETKELHPRLGAFLTRWLSVIRGQREAAEPPLRGHWEQLEAQIAVALVLLGDDGAEPRKEITAGWNDDGSPKVVELSTVEERVESLLAPLAEPWAARARDEVRLILAKQGLEVSPLFDYQPGRLADYTQFTPRSHYTRNQALRGWFRAMMYLGRNGWPLRGESTTGLSHALLLGESLGLPAADGKAALTEWTEIMAITSFFAGGSDDVDFPELRRWLAGHADLAAWTPDQALDPATLTKLRENLGQLRPPGILSQVRREVAPGEDLAKVRAETLQFRVFGQRFTYDAWVLGELTPPAGEDFPATPTALYVAAALGEPRARELALDWFGSVAPDRREAFAGRLDELTRTLAGVQDEAWFASMATKKLHLIGTLAGRREAGYPSFMRSPAWGAKHVEGMLGAYTELKHDTVLFAKQSYAEMGEGGDTDRIDESTVPYGFVPPELRFWAELERLVSYTLTGFQKYRLLPNVVEDWGHLGRFSKDVAALRLLANKTATGEKWSVEDRLWLLGFNPSYMAEPVDPSVVPGPDDGKTALVTDIHTNARDGEILYQGLGRPYLVLALVGDGGVNRLVAGTAFDYYEFSGPIAERLNDEDWRKTFYRLDPETRDKPSWTVPPVRGTKLVPVE